MDELLYNMKKGIGKKGQQTMGMPFGIIFAIFLIIVFVVIAFIAVRGFLDIGKSSGVGMFYRELQDAVDDSWGGQSSEINFTIDLPSDIKRVCFADLTANEIDEGPEYNAIRNYDVYDANTFLIPPEYAQGMEWKLIEHINITRITKDANPYCVDVEDELQINKGFYDKLVWIE